MTWWKFYSPSFGILGGFVMTTEMLPTRARIDVIQSATLSSLISKSCWKLGHRTGLATTKVGHHLDSDAHLPPTQPDGNDEWTTTEWMQSVLLVQSGGEIIVEGKVWMNLLVGVRWWKSYRKMKTGESGRREWSCEASMCGWCQGYLGFSIFNRNPPWQNQQSYDIFIFFVSFSQISRQSIDACKDYFRDDLLKSDWALMVELKKQFQIL